MRVEHEGSIQNWGPTSIVSPVFRHICVGSFLQKLKNLGIITEHETWLHDICQNLVQEGASVGGRAARFSAEHRRTSCSNHLEVRIPLRLASIPVRSSLNTSRWAYAIPQVSPCSLLTGAVTKDENIIAFQWWSVDTNLIMLMCNGASMFMFILLQAIFLVSKLL